MENSTNTTEVVSARAITAVLIPIAFAAMTQSSGLVCEADADVGFPLRMSPVICVLDAINIIYKVAVPLCSGRSLREAIGAMLLWRFKGQHHAGLRVLPPDAPPKSTLKTVANIVQRVVCGPATIFAFIKMCGFEGLVWTKVIAAAFFFSFIVSELLVVWPATIWPEMLIPGPDSNMTPRPNETPDSDEIPGFDETHEPNETPEPSKTTGPNRTPDSNEITESNETLEINRTLESNETLEIDQTPESIETLEINQTPELNETHESNENSESDKDPESHKNPKSKKKRAYLKTYSSIALAVMFMLWFASAAAQDCFGEPHHTQPRWLAGTTGALGCPLAMFALVYVSHWKFVEMMKRWVSTFILDALVFLTLGSYLIGRLVPCHTSSIMPQFITAILAAAWCGIALWFSTEALRELRDEPGNDDRREKVEIISAWYFFCLNFATALIYYMYSYNPAGTAKPHWDWEEWLG